MKKVYADLNLEYEKGEFKRPDHMDISFDCSKYHDPNDPEMKPQDDSWGNPNN